MPASNYATYKDKRVDIPLTNVSDKWTNKNFICDLAFTKVPVATRTGILGKYGKEHLRLVKSVVEERGRYLTALTVTRDLSNLYYIQKHGLHDIVTEDDYREVKLPFMAEADRVEGLESLLMIEKEHSVAELVRNTATYPVGNSTTLSGQSQFSDFTHSDPVKTITDARKKIFDTGGVIANAAVIPWPVMLTLRFHPKLLSAAGTGTLHQMTDDNMKRLLELDEIFIPRSFYYPASNVLTPIWGKDIILYHKEPTPRRAQTTFAYNLVLEGMENRVFRKDREPTGTNIWQEKDYTWKVQNNQEGYLIKNAIA